MGIREAAAAAVAAENATKNAELEALKVRTAQAAVREVKERLGLDGVAVSLPNLTLGRAYSDHEIGNLVTVKVTDDDLTLYFLVKRYLRQEGYDQWTRRYTSQTPVVEFELANEKGYRPKHPVAEHVTLKGHKMAVDYASATFSDLAGLGRELVRYEAWLADENGNIGRTVEDWKVWKP